MGDVEDYWDMLQYVYDKHSLKFISEMIARYFLWEDQYLMNLGSVYYQCIKKQNFTEVFVFNL